MAKKRRDRRFIDDNGDQWDSRFEWLVFVGLRDSGYRVRRCTDRDSIAYHHPVTQGRCLECGSGDCVQERIYTPDLYVADPESPHDPEASSRGYFVECKGYFPADKRALLRSVAASNPGVDLRVLFAKESKLTKARTNVEYVNRMIKLTAGAWNDGALKWSFV